MSGKKTEEILVKKFGGTSVGSIERIQSIAERLKEDAEKGHKQVVVVSAMGDSTDTLVELSRRISKRPDPREYDALVATGENVSAALLAMSLISMELPAISLNGIQAGVKTESFHNQARILEVNTARIRQELDLGKIVVVTGFQGVSEMGDITTIGRGGSDTSAVVLAAALGSSLCEIYTDVDGVYTTDPRIVSNARKLSVISSEEMLELASTGAGVLHPRSVECAKKNNITLHVRSSFDFREGTLVKEQSDMEVQRPVTGVALMDSETIITLLDLEDKPGRAAMLFDELSKSGVNVDMIVQGSARGLSNSITFTVAKDNAEKAKEIAQECMGLLDAKQVLIDEEVAKVSIIGIGMVSKPGVATKMFKTLGDNGINIKIITTSEIKVSCAIDRADAKRAIALLHDAFDLDKDLITAS